MALPRSVRFDDELEKRIENYLEKNKVKFPQLIRLAVEKFISEPQTIELVPADTAEFLRAADSAYAQHRHAMDKLK